MILLEKEQPQIAAMSAPLSWQAKHIHKHKQEGEL